MEVVYDPTKDASNRAKHGVSLAAAVELDWANALVWADARKDYGEPRYCALGAIGTRVYYVAYVERDDKRRIISLRKANIRETRRYVEEA